MLIVIIIVVVYCCCCKGGKSKLFHCYFLVEFSLSDRYICEYFFTKGLLI